MRPPPACRACSPPGMSPITSTARPSPPPVPAAWRRSTPIATSRCSTPEGAGSAAPHPTVERIELHRSILSVPQRDWNALGGGDPFTRHEFLAALERTQCVGRASGWEPRYLTLHDAAGLAAAVAAFVKTHSFGEFVFDFGWA